MKTGAGVRHVATGLLGRVVSRPSAAMRGYVIVAWDGIDGVWTMRAGNVALVASTYAAAKRWEAAEARGSVSNNQGKQP